MGAVQEQTPELGPFMVELRSESFRVARIGTTGDAVRADMAARVLTIPERDVPALVAALTMGVERGCLWGGGTATDPKWVVTRASEAVSIAGPWALVTSDAYPDEDTGVDSYERVAGEIEYVSAPALLAALQN